MRVMMLLADHAAVAEDKLYINGGGWSVIGPGPAPFAIAIKLNVPWDRAGRPLPLELHLVDADGAAVTQPTDHGPVPVELSATLNVARPDHLPPGIPIDAALAINIAPLVLPPGQRFTWELTLDGERDADWHLAFSTRPA